MITKFQITKMKNKNKTIFLFFMQINLIYLVKLCYY